MLDNNEINENEPSEVKINKITKNLRLNTIEDNNIGKLQKTRKLKRLKKDKNKKTENIDELKVSKKKNPSWITQI
jgi:hypothetical protein